MSKNSLYLIVAIALAATAATFFVSKHDTQQSCFMNDTIIQGDAEAIPKHSVPATYAVVRGYPFGYYQEPWPAGCVPASNSVVSTTFNTAHLSYDLLIWLAVAVLLFVPSALLKMWRGPRMLGDKR